jgi:hypothetical protein
VLGRVIQDNLAAAFDALSRACLLVAPHACLLIREIRAQTDFGAVGIRDIANEYLQILPNRLASPDWRRAKSNENQY